MRNMDADHIDSVTARPQVRLLLSPCALRGNIRELKKQMPSDATLAAVVKADAYGHGMEWVSRIALEEGCRFLAVSNLAEALALRRCGISGEVLIIGPIFPEECDEVVANRFAVAVGSVNLAQSLSKSAHKMQIPARAHLKFDTGMGRYGFLDESKHLISTMKKIANLDGIHTEGAMTHFSEADVAGSDFTQDQARRFRLVLRELRTIGIQPKWVHAANSSALAFHPETSFSMARIGIAMHGAFSEKTKNNLHLEPVMSAETDVVELRDVPKGHPVSYGRTFITTRPSRLALLPLGYGDGYPRSASNKGHVLIRGCRAPIVGRVTMSLIVVDVTNIDGASVGDSVLLFGQKDGQELPVEELAQAADTIGYEILCNMGSHGARFLLEE